MGSDNEHRCDRVAVDGACHTVNQTALVMRWNPGPRLSASYLGDGPRLWSPVEDCLDWSIDKSIRVSVGAAMFEGQ